MYLIRALITVNFIFQAKNIALESTCNFAKVNIFNNGYFLNYFPFDNSYAVKKCIGENFIVHEFSHLRMKSLCVVFYVYIKRERFQSIILLFNLVNISHRFHVIFNECILPKFCIVITYFLFSGY